MHVTKLVAVWGWTKEYARYLGEAHNIQGAVSRSEHELQLVAKADQCAYLYGVAVQGAAMSSYIFPGLNTDRIALCPWPCLSDSRTVEARSDDRS